MTGFQFAQHQRRLATDPAYRDAYQAVTLAERAIAKHKRTIIQIRTGRLDALLDAKQDAGNPYWAESIKTWNSLENQTIAKASGLLAALDAANRNPALQS